MCGFTTKDGQEGVLFSDGIFVKIEDISLGNITPNQRKELEDMKITNELHIRKRLHELGNISQNIFNRLTSIEEKLNSARKKGFMDNSLCPINEPAIEKIAVKATRKWFKESILSAGNIATAIAAILALLGIIIAIKEHI